MSAPVAVRHFAETTARKARKEREKRNIQRSVKADCRSYVRRAEYAIRYLCPVGCGINEEPGTEEEEPGKNRYRSTEGFKKICSLHDTPQIPSSRPQIY